MLAVSKLSFPFRTNTSKTKTKSKWQSVTWKTEPSTISTWFFLWNHGDFQVFHVTRWPFSSRWHPRNTPSPPAPYTHGPYGAKGHFGGGLGAEPVKRWILKGSCYQESTPKKYTTLKAPKNHPKQHLFTGHSSAPWGPKAPAHGVQSLELQPLFSVCLPIKITKNIFFEERHGHSFVPVFVVFFF